MKFVNRENIYSKLLLLIRYFFKVSFNHLFYHFIKNIKINDILYLGNIILNLK